MVVHRSATVRNNGITDVTAGYYIDLYVQRNFGSFELVQSDFYPNGNFPANGDTMVSGNITYAFPADATQSYVLFRFDPNGVCSP